MDMKKMLAALDGVESAEGTASSVAQKGSMKSLLESLDSVVAEEVAVEEVVAEEVEEELEEAQSPAQKAAFEKMLAAKKGNKADDKDDEEDKDEVDESVEETEEVVAEEELEEAIMVSAEGGEAAELLAILKNAGMPAMSAPAMPEPEMDMQDEYSNSPDEVEMDLDAVIASGDDLHREKEQFAAAASGDNPMKAFEGKFQSILDELLAEDDVVVAEEMVAEETEEVVAEEVEETTEEAVAVNESAEFSDMKHFMQRLNG